MSIKYPKLVLLLLALLMLYTGQSQVVINEMLASNSNGLIDEDGDYPDWIELYNTTNASINLNNYALSDQEDNLMKWALPDVELAAQSFLLIFASGKDRNDPGQNLHSNFKISAAGEQIFLINPSGDIIHQLGPIPMNPNQSYGAFPDGATVYKYYDLPTPEKTNVNSTTLQFSKERGFYSEEINLSITAADLAGTTIYYTLDGSLPTPSSNVYTQPLNLKDRSNEENTISNIRTTHGKPEEHDRFHHWLWQAPDTKIAKANVVRAQAYLDNQPVSKVYSNTYFIFNQAADRYSFPVISLITAPENLFDEEEGIYVPGIRHDSGNPEWTGNYFQKGRDWEKAMHIEFFEDDGQLAFSQDAGARIHGGNTRDAAQKSIRMYARDDYGKEYFNYPLFPQREQEQFKKFIIRSSITCWNNTIIKDALSHQIVKDLHLDIQNYQPVIVFINGAYWGIQTLRELNDERYLAARHNLDKDSIEVIDSWNSMGHPHYDAFKNFYSTQDLSLDANLDTVEQYINLENYIDYQIAEIYFANLDWPGNNLERWKYQTAESKWQWIFYDIDGGYFDPSMNTLEYARDDNSNHWANPEPTTRLFRKLMENETFQLRFANRFAELLNTVFDPDVILPMIESFTNQYAPEIEEHILRWHFPESKNKWLSDISGILKNFVVNRTCYLQEYLLQAVDIEVFRQECFEPPSASSAFKVYPNPSDGFTNIEITTATTTSKLIEIYNNLGQKLDQILVQTNSTEYLDLTKFPAGIYYLKLAEENTVHKLVLY